MVPSIRIEYPAAFHHVIAGENGENADGQKFLDKMDLRNI
jgi:hypothetical protein